MFFWGRYFRTTFEIRNVPVLYLSVYTRLPMEKSCFLGQITTIDRFECVASSVPCKGLLLCPLPFVDVHEKGTDHFIRRFRSVKDLCHLFGES